MIPARRYRAVALALFAVDVISWAVVLAFLTHMVLR
jgi:hypothetical protein